MCGPKFFYSFLEISFLPVTVVKYFCFGLLGAVGSVIFNRFSLSRGLIYLFLNFERSFQFINSIISWIFLGLRQKDNISSISFLLSANSVPTWCQLGASLLSTWLFVSLTFLNRGWTYNMAWKRVLFPSVVDLRLLFKNTVAKLVQEFHF